MRSVTGAGGSFGNPTVDGLFVGIAFLLGALVALWYLARGLFWLLDRLSRQTEEEKIAEEEKAERWFEARGAQLKRWRDSRTWLPSRKVQAPAPVDKEASRVERQAAIERARFFIATQAAWPSTRWQLTAPECYQLRYSGEGFAMTTFRLAVKELVAARALRVRPVKGGGRWRGKEPAALTAGPHAGVAAEAPLAPVLELFARSPKRRLQTAEVSTLGTRSFEGVLMKDYLRAARMEFGRFYDYRSQYVFSALEARGLVTCWRASPKAAWTDTGREAAEELDEWLLIGKERIGDWVSEDPQAALAYTSGLGATVLLMDDLDPEFALLAQYLPLEPMAS